MRSATPCGEGWSPATSPLVARAPKQRSLQRIEGVSLTDTELRLLLRTAAGHRYFPLYWLTAMTGMRRNEVLGLKWPDIDFKKRRLHLNRGLVAVGYELHQTRGKTKTARVAASTSTPRPSPSSKAGEPSKPPSTPRLASTTTEQWVFTDGNSDPVHPHAVYEAFRRIVHNAGVPTIRFHDLRHTHGSLLIKEGIPVKVVSERLGHSNIAFTMQTYQHVLPGMQAHAARTIETLTAVPPATPRRRKAGGTSGEHHRKP